MDRFLRSIGRRLAWVRRAEAGSVGWICGLLAAGGIIFFTDAIWSWCLPPLGGLAGLLLAQTPTRLQVADLADRHFGTRELFGTVVRMASVHGLGSNPAAPALMAQAAETVGGLNASAVPARLRGGAWWMVVGLLSVLIPAASLLGARTTGSAVRHERAQYVYAKDVIGAHRAEILAEVDPPSADSTIVARAAPRIPQAAITGLDRGPPAQGAVAKPGEPATGGSGSYGKQRGTAAASGAALLSRATDRLSRPDRLDRMPQEPDNSYPPADSALKPGSGPSGAVAGNLGNAGASAAGRVERDMEGNASVSSRRTGTGYSADLPAQPLDQKQLRRVPGRYRDLVRHYFSGRAD